MKDKYDYVSGKSIDSEEELLVNFIKMLSKVLISTKSFQNTSKENQKFLLKAG